MTALVRPAVTADLPFLVWVMQEASTSHLDRSVWSTILRIPDADTAELLGAVATSDRPHWCHLDRFRVVEVDGTAVAAASGYDPAVEGNDALFAAALGILTGAGVDDADAHAVLQRAGVVDAVTPKPYPDAWGIENVAVSPSHRGAGLAGLLLDTIADDARAQGRENVQIMYLEGNDRAQRAWERAGFTVRAGYRSTAFAELVGAPGMKLLVRS